jgi:hypothetical protein
MLVRTFFDRLSCLEYVRKDFSLDAIESSNDFSRWRQTPPCIFNADDAELLPLEDKDAVIHFLFYNYIATGKLDVDANHKAFFETATLAMRQGAALGIKSAAVSALYECLLREEDRWGRFFMMHEENLHRTCLSVPDSHEDFSEISTLRSRIQLRSTTTAFLGDVERDLLLKVEALWPSRG